MKKSDEEKSEGLYLLQDGTHAAPGDCSKGKDGVLRHKNGLAVCLYEDGKPQTVGEDAERNKNVMAVEMGELHDDEDVDDDADEKIAKSPPPEEPKRAAARR